MIKTLHLFLAIMMPVLILINYCAGGACPLGGCGAGDESWQESAQAFLNSEDPIVGTIQNQNFNTGSFTTGKIVGESLNGSIDREAEKANADLSMPELGTTLYPDGKLLKSMDAAFGSSVLIDVSNQTSKGDARLKGAIHIPSTRFLYNNGTLRTASELTSVLGEAGINSSDAVIVYSDAFSSGEAAFVLWVLSYLGHKDVRALDGGLNDWIAASLPLETKENMKPSTNYVPQMRPELLADYDYVKSKASQLVDARSFQDYGKKSIPNSILISPDDILDNSRLKAGAQLNDTFARLDRSRPVIVYSSDLLSASLVWYALQIMGFDSRLYTWQDWQAHEELKI